MSGAEIAKPWKHLPCEVHPVPYYRTSCALIALSTDIVIENEFRSLSRDDLLALRSSISEAARIVISQDPLDVVAVGCAAAAMAIGPDELHRLVREARPGVKVTDPVSACLAVFASKSITKIAIVTPYPDDVNEGIERFYEQHGIKIVAKASFKRPGGEDISRIDPQSILEAATEIGTASEAECVLLSCTALRSRGILREAGITLEKPVFSSNSALAWHVRQLSDAGDLS
ncbi:hypothetical protein FS815_23955 [Agrobacterium vitis]|uniref:maleate cis-trans isomerase family protein n=1 Tax=Allorhizobium ampelinum TaxID=3025782 RepID=UPI001F43E6AE|nr:hypothetical protein [Allorhizobium ampelinum]MCF1449847.1 hypothetical protein [Allorhizobium ampelinum]